MSYQFPPDPNDPNDPRNQQQPPPIPGLMPQAPQGVPGMPAPGAGQAPPGTMPGGAPQQFPLSEQQAQQATSLPSEKSQAFQLARQYKLADALRADAKQQMGGKQVGRVFVGPKWWDAAASLGADAVANFGEKKANDDFGKFQAKQGRSGMDILRQKGLLGPSSDDDKDDKYASY